MYGKQYVMRNFGMGWIDVVSGQRDGFPSNLWMFLFWDEKTLKEVVQCICIDLSSTIRPGVSEPSLANDHDFYQRKKTSPLIKLKGTLGFLLY